MLCTFVILAMHTACPAQLTMFGLIVIVIFGEEYKLWSLSLWIFLHYHFNSCPFDQISSGLCCQPSSIFVYPLQRDSEFLESLTIKYIVRLSYGSYVWM